MGGRPLPEPVEVTPDYQTDEERPPVYTDRYMEGVRATDGTDIGSRAKRREYMRIHGLADAADFKGEWASEAKKRESIRTGHIDTQQRREAIARALEKRR